MHRVVICVLIVAGLTGSGLLIGLLGGFLGTALFRFNPESWESLVGAISGTMIGYPVGIAAGLLILRKLFRVNGSLKYGIAGGVLGVVLVLLLAAPLQLNIYTNAVVPVFLLLPPILATAGYFYDRIIPRRKDSPAG